MKCVFSFYLNFQNVHLDIDLVGIACTIFNTGYNMVWNLNQTMTMMGKQTITKFICPLNVLQYYEINFMVKKK